MRFWTVVQNQLVKFNQLMKHNNAEAPDSRIKVLSNIIPVLEFSFEHLE
jgi:hypothetical protein